MNESEASALAYLVGAVCIAYRVRLLGCVITGMNDRVPRLRPLGVKANQATILVMLSPSERASSVDMARVLMMEKSTVSRTVDRMKKNGWISVEGQMTDRPR